MEDEFVRYHDLLSAIKTRIRGAQVKAALSANQEMLFMYWDIGRMIDQRQRTEGWGAAVIPRLARDILNHPYSSPCLSYDPIGSENLRLASQHAILSRVFDLPRPQYQFVVDDELLML